jgi:hypothetical protein
MQNLKLKKMINKRSGFQEMRNMGLRKRRSD